MNRLIEIKKKQDILAAYNETPIGKLLEYHNLSKAQDSYSDPQLLIGMCMDHRKKLHIPKNFSFIIRTGGANMANNEFKISYAISIAGVKHMALIGHTQCGMVNLHSKKEAFIKGLVENAGWTKQDAEDHFKTYAPRFEIGNEIDFILNETKRLRIKYPKICIAPLLYKVEDNLLYQINEK